MLCKEMPCHVRKVHAVKSISQNNMLTGGTNILRLPKAMCYLGGWKDVFLSAFLHTEYSISFTNISNTWKKKFSFLTVLKKIIASGLVGKLVQI